MGDNIHLLSSITIAIIILLPGIISTWPIIISRLQDQYPEQIKNGNILYMFFSPILDRREIIKGTDSNDILKHALKTGLKPMVDRSVNPVIRPIEVTQDVIGDTLNSVTVAIQNGIQLPMRSLYLLGSTLTDSLNKVFQTVSSLTVNVGQAIQGALNSLVAGTMVGLHMQATSFNLIISGIRFFMWVVEMGGIAVITAGTLMMFSLFTIIPGIVLVTLGSILTNISANSEYALRFA